MKLFRRKKSYFYDPRVKRYKNIYMVDIYEYDGKKSKMVFGIIGISPQEVLAGARGYVDMTNRQK